MFRLDPRETALDHLSDTTRARAGAAVLSPAAQRIIAKPAEPILSAPVITGVARAIEALLLAALGLGIHLAYVGGTNAVTVAVVLGTSVLANFLIGAAHAHRIAAYRSLARQCGRVLAAWSVTFAVLVVGVFLFKVSDATSRLWLVSWYATGAVTLVLYRLALRALILRWGAEGRLKRRTVIVGGGKDAEALIDTIRKSAAHDIELFGLFDDRADKRSPENVAGCPKLGTVADLVEFARRTRVDLVIVSMPLSAETRVLQMLKQLWVLPVDIRLSAHMSKLRFTRDAYSYVGDLPVFDMADRPISDWSLVFKFFFDRGVAALALLLLSPLMIATAIAIKLDSPGPVLFRQKRHGFNNELIEVFKFRSMYVEQSDAHGTASVTRGDPRVTRVGRFIRRTSIDELPQLFNVLLGQLSIVGPRPHALESKAADTLFHEAVDGYFARHKVKPGITGWAQIHGWRGETDTLDKLTQRVSHDLYYIENWSPLLDLQILFMTPFSLISKSENAY